MTRLQICLAAFTVLLGRGALAHSTQDSEMGFSGGLTVQDPPAGWPLSELGHQDRARAMAAAAAPVPRESWQAASTTWGAVQEPEPAESRGSVRWYSPSPAEPFAADQQQMASQGDGWFAPEDLPLRQGRVLAAHPDPHPPSAPPPAQHMYFAMSQDAVAAAGSESPQAWQPSNSRYKRKRVKSKQQLQEQQQQAQSDQEQAIQHQQHEQQQQHQQQMGQQQHQQQLEQQQHQQQLEQQQQLQQQQQQQLIQQQHQQLELQNQQQLQEPQLQHEPPPVEVKKSKKHSKRVNKRRPPPAVQSQPPQQHVLSQVPEGGQGPDPTVSVGYSIGFAAGPESGERHNGDFYRGSVQNEVVHGDGAVSYTNTALPAGQEGLQPEQQGGVISSSAINGRPIYVPPLQQTSSVTFGSPAPTAGYQALPTPQALIGGPQPAFNLVAVTPSPAPAGPFIISTTPSYSTHTIFGSGSAKSEFSLGPTHKPPKAVSAVLHINDGTDFAWQDVGNGVEVSAPITPNGLHGGYRDSIPIMEDTDDADPPAVPFEASTAAALQGAGPPAYAHSQGAVFGESGRVESAEARPLLETPSNHLADEPPSKPDPFRGFTSSSFIDFMRAYTSNTRQPHSGGRGPSGLGDSLLNTKLGQVYYIPNDTPGGDPIPAIIMPLSRLRELQAALPSGKKPVFDLPPGEAEQPHFGKAPSFAESPFKSSSFSDIPFKSSFDEPSNAFKSQSFSDGPFKFADSPFKTPSPSDSPFSAEAPYKSSFGGGDHRGPGGPPPSKYRPSFGKGPGKEVYFKHQRPGPPQHVSYKQQGPRFGASSPGVKVTKSVAVYEDHQTVNNKQPQVSANEQNPTLQWPPKETIDVQTYLMPIEQFDGLKSSGSSLPPGHPGHHGPVRGQGPPSGPPHHREVRRPAGHRPMRAHQLHQQQPHQQQHQQQPHQQQHQQQQPHQQAQFHPAHHLPSQHESGAFAVTSSYRVRPSAG